MNGDAGEFLAAGTSAAKVLETLDGNGIRFALVSAEGTVLWASDGLVRSRGDSLIGSPCHPGLLRRSTDCAVCRREEVLTTGKPHRCWIPSRRAGRFDPRQMLVQMRTADGNLLEALIEAGPAERLFQDQIFRERVLSEGLKHVRAGVLLLDPAMRVVSSNPAANRLLRASADELRGQDFVGLLPAGTFADEGGHLASQLVDRGGLECSEVVVGAGSEQQIFHVSLAAVSAQDGSLAAGVAILRDLTPERLVGEALSRKVGELSLLREIGHVLARTVRLDQVLRVILAAVVHPFGLGFDRAALFLCEEREELLRGRLARCRPTSENLPHRGDIGQELEALAFGPVQEEDRQIEALVKSFRIGLDQTGEPLIAALAGRSPLLFAAREHPGTTPTLTALFGDGPAFLAPLATQGKKLGVLVGVSASGQNPLDGDRLTLAGMIADTAAGAIERARLHDELAERLADLRDANARQRYLQGQLLRAEQMSAIGELAAEIVHQIRNPLAVVGGFARRLERGLEDEDPRRADAAILIEEADRMEKILERIRQDVRLARLPAKDSVPPGELVEAALARYRAVAREQGCRLDATVESELPLIRGSRDIMLEVLDNLVRNAFDAVAELEEPGTVTVSARRLREAVHLLVEDNGPGLSPVELSKIFEPFYTTKLRGTGLGLPLSKRLIAQCGGSLTVDSRPGEGARFRIVMPVVGEPPGAARDEAKD